MAANKDNGQNEKNNENNNNNNNINIDSLTMALKHIAENANKNPEQCESQKKCVFLLCLYTLPFIFNIS